MMYQLALPVLFFLTAVVIGSPSGLQSRAAADNTVYVTDANKFWSVYMVVPLVISLHVHL